MNQSSMGWTALNLLESVLTLYSANTDGTPNLDSPVWSGVPAQNLRVADRWIKVETRPTGAPYPKKHPLLPQFEISIERVWALYLDNLDGIIPDENTYVLDIVWTDEESGNWHRETFYGVTISDRSRAGRNEDAGFTEELVFDAQYYIRDSGRGSPPGLSATLPMQVVFVDASGSALPIYNYDPANHAFTETQSGIAATRATVAQNEIIFADAGYPIFWLDDAGAARTFNLVTGAPARSAVPRVDFCIGPNRVASLDAKGTFYSSQFLGNPPLAQAEAFQFSGVAATLQLTLDGSAARANAWHLFNPTDISGGACQLKCWARVENLADLDDGQTVALWPDESGSGNDLQKGFYLAINYRAGIFYRNSMNYASSGQGYRSNLPYRTDQLNYAGQSAAPPPSYSERPGTDLTTRETLPVSGPAVLMESGDTLATLGNAFNPDTNCLFMVVCPFGFNATGRLLNGGSFGDSANDFSLELAAGKIQANFWVQTAPITVTEEIALGNSVLMPGWYLFEQSGSATGLIATVNEIQAASVTFAGTPAGTRRPIQLGSGNNGFAGYVKAVLVYEGSPTDEEKFWVRLFLNNAYQIS